MSLPCSEALALLTGYAAETLAPDDRRRLRAHLADCCACREEAAHADEGLLFASASAEEVSAEDLARILSGVHSAVALKRAQRRLEASLVRPGSRRGARGRRRGLLVGAAAVVVIFTLAFPGRGPRSAQAPATEARLANPGSPSPGPVVGVERPAAASPQEIPNSKFPADATIYDWNLGSGQPRVVWIVDRSLDI